MKKKSDQDTQIDCFTIYQNEIIDSSTLVLKTKIKQIYLRKKMEGKEEKQARK